MLRTWIMKATVIAFLGSISFAVYAVAETQRIDIPAGELAAALESLAKQAEVDLVYSDAQVRGLKTAGARGELSPQEAIAKLLEGTPLEVRKDEASGALLIARPSVGQPAKSEEATGGKVETAKQQGQKTAGGQKKSFWDRFRVAQADQAQSAGGLGEHGAPSQDEGVKLEEVVVTAQKRSEIIQDVPLSVNAISAEQFAEYNYTRLSDFASTVPGLQVDSGGAPGFQTVSLRGVTTGNLYGSATTAVNVDDVPVGPSASYAYGASFGSIDLMPYDLDHVEVLKGPQGTLYGASSMGGLLKYVPTTPDLTKNIFKGGTDGSTVAGGSRAGYGVRGYANIVAIGGELAFSLSGAHNYTPGFITNSVTGEQHINSGTQDAARLAANWKVGERLSVRLQALVNNSDSDYLSVIPVTTTGDPQEGRFDARWFARSGLAIKNRLYTANVRYDWDRVSLTSVSGYFDGDSTAPADATIYPFFSTVLGVLAPYVDEITLHKFSQELRLSSPESGRLQWVLGGFYTRENAALFEQINALDPATGLSNPAYDPLDSIRRPSKFKEKAVYGNVGLDITPNWDLNAGLRYSHNDQTVSTYGVGPNGAGGYLFGSTTDPYATPLFDASESTTTYSLSTRYHFAPSAMVYARVASGYRPGGSNTGVVGAPPTFDADTLTNYELGVKSQFIERRLLVNAAAFYIDWKKVQLGQYTSAHLIFTGNAATAASYGAELTTQYTVFPSLRIGLNAVYNNAKLTADAPAVSGRNGDRLPLSAQWSGAATVDWTHALNNSYSLTAGALWSYVGDRLTDFPGGGGIPGGSNYLHIPSYDSLDLSFGISNTRWAARLYGRNVTNSYSYLRYYAPLATVLQPRTVGLALDVTLGVDR